MLQWVVVHLGVVALRHDLRSLLLGAHELAVLVAWAGLVAAWAGLVAAWMLLAVAWWLPDHLHNKAWKGAEAVVVVEQLLQAWGPAWAWPFAQAAPCPMSHTAEAVHSVAP